MNAEMNGQIPNPGASAQQITANSFAAKYKSKREVYNFLTIDCKAYLPAYDTITIYFLKDLINGTKKSKSHIFIIINISFEQL